jgi:histidine ammonia-lyase/phenylalanine ammonia-lyase
MTVSGPVELDGRSLKLSEVLLVAREHAQVTLSARSRPLMEASFDLNRRLLAEGTTIYGVTTGVGDSVGVRVALDKARALQETLVRLNGCGTGPELPEDQARAVVLARANCLSRGASAVRPVIVERMLELINRGWVPVIPEQGSIGASGDLVPSSYIAAVLMGEREVRRGGVTRSAAELWQELGLDPIRLEPKEGLAILNGTCFMTGIAALAVLDAERLARMADLCTALTCEALTAIGGPFHPFIQEVKPHPGQARSADRIRSLLSGSRLVVSYADAVENSRRVQDNYSVRCAPQCVGALYDAVEWCRAWVERELNSANDNPLYDPAEGRVHSGGNFSGFHVALAMDALKVAAASVADLVDRQFELMVDEKFNAGLTPNLTARLPDDDPGAGLQHGFKSLQLVVSSLAAEALGRCMPMSAFSRSTEAHNQDKVSMGAAAARGARDVVELAELCCAIHLLGACQAADLRGERRLGEGTRAAYERIRTVSSFVERDRVMQTDIQAVADLIRAGSLG